MRKSFYPFLVIFLLSYSCLAQSSTQILTTNEGYQLQVELKPAKDTVMLAESTFITLEIYTLRRIYALR
jgi:hypothetical protein